MAIHDLGFPCVCSVPGARRVHENEFGRFANAWGGDIVRIFAPNVVGCLEIVNFVSESLMDGGDVKQPCIGCKVGLANSSSVGDGLIEPVNCAALTLLKWRSLVGFNCPEICEASFSQGPSAWVAAVRRTI